MGQGERRNKTKISSSRREREKEGTKDVSATNKSTYKNVSETRESKMPSSSSVRSLKSISLKEPRDEIDQIVRDGSILRPTTTREL